MYVATVMSIQRNYADHAPHKQGGDVGEVEQPRGHNTLAPDSDEERDESPRWSEGEHGGAKSRNAPSKS